MMQICLLTQVVPQVCTNTLHLPNSLVARIQGKGAKQLLVLLQQGQVLSLDVDYSQY